MWQNLKQHFDRFTFNVRHKSFSELLGMYKYALLFIFLGILGFIILVPIITYIVFAQDLQSKNAIMNRNNTGLTLLDQDGKPFFSFYQAKSVTQVPLNNVPKITQDATIASEDKNFYTNPGVSFRGMLRAFYTDITRQSLQQGGSTITQELVRTSLLTQQKTIMRKYQEVVLAYELNRRYSKQDILEMYFNSVYYGEGAFGIENAAETYFGIHAQNLDLAESALLTGLLPAPSAYSPLSNDPSIAKQQQKLVLTKMQQQGYITSQQEQAAIAEQLTYNTHHDTFNTLAPHFALMIRDALIQKYGEEQVIASGFRVKTTLNRQWQEYAEQVVKQQVQRLAPDNVSNGAAVVIDPKTGEVRALVGSYDWNDDKNGKVNMATTPRQPGSSFKPIIYQNAIENKLITAATLLPDLPENFGGYKPHDYDYKYRGMVTVRRALSNSLNIPAVEVMQKVGVPQGVAAAQNLGITTLTHQNEYGLSLVLGAAEVPLIQMTDAYATFANKGVYNNTVLYTEIDDKNGKVVYQYQPDPKSVLDTGATFILSSILSDSKARAEEFGNALSIFRPAAVKTGTTSDFKDSLTIGYEPNLAIGVWVGNNDNTPMDNIAGSLGAAPIWRELMTRFLADLPTEKFTQPSNVVQMPVCPAQGLTPQPGQATPSAILYTEYFLQGTEPTQPCQPTPTPSPTPSATPTPSPTTTTSPTITPFITPTQMPTITPIPTITSGRSPFLR